MTRPFGLTDEEKATVRADVAAWPPLPPDVGDFLRRAFADEPPTTS
jgi:hypothetical protein